MTLTKQQMVEEAEGIHELEANHLQPGDSDIDISGTGLDSAEFTEPELDPQWVWVWKLGVDPVTGDEWGEKQVRVPRNGWAQGADPLVSMRRPDGGMWFSVRTPARLKPVPNHECFVGDCKRRVDTLVKLVGHVEAFHYNEAEIYSEVLKRIKSQVAFDDPRLQKILTTLETREVGQVSNEDVEVAQAAAQNCHSCGEPITGKLKNHTCKEG